MALSPLRRPLKSFHIFPNLPIELRLAIYTTALLEPSEIHFQMGPIHYHYSPDAHFHLAQTLWLHDLPPTKSHLALHPLSRTNCESRDTFFRTHQRLFKRTDRPDELYTYVCWTSTLLSLSCLNLPLLADMDLSGIKSLRLKLEEPHWLLRNGARMVEYLQKMAPSLQELRVTCTRGMRERIMYLNVLTGYPQQMWEHMSVLQGLMFEELFFIDAIRAAAKRGEPWDHPTVVFHNAYTGKVFSQIHRTSVGGNGGGSGVGNSGGSSGAKEVVSRYDDSLIGHFYIIEHVGFEVERLVFQIDLDEDQREMLLEESRERVIERQRRERLNARRWGPRYENERPRVLRRVETFAGPLNGKSA